MTKKPNDEAVALMNELSVDMRKMLAMSDIARELYARAIDMLDQGDFTGMRLAIHEQVKLTEKGHNLAHLVGTKVQMMEDADGEFYRQSERELFQVKLRERVAEWDLDTLHKAKRQHGDDGCDDPTCPFDEIVDEAIARAQVC